MNKMKRGDAPFPQPPQTYLIMDEAAVQAVMWQFFPLYEHVGLVVESAQGGIYRCRVPLNRQNGNHLNTVHAAIQWAAAQVLGGLVVVSAFGPEGFSTVFAAVRSVAIDFQRPARTTTTAEAALSQHSVNKLRQCVFAGDETAFSLHDNVCGGAGETVAIADANYVVRPQRRSQ